MCLFTPDWSVVSWFPVCFSSADRPPFVGAPPLSSSTPPPAPAALLSSGAPAPLPSPASCHHRSAGETRRVRKGKRNETVGGFWKWKQNTLNNWMIPYLTCFTFSFGHPWWVVLHTVASPAPCSYKPKTKESMIYPVSLHTLLWFGIKLVNWPQNSSSKTTKKTQD